MLLMPANTMSVGARLGNVLRFPGAGRATVSVVNRRHLAHGRQQVLVHVNRDLDPDAGGYPHAIEMVEGE